MAKTNGYRAMMECVRGFPQNRRNDAVKVIVHLWEIDRLLICFVFCMVVGVAVLSVGVGFVARMMGVFETTPLIAAMWWCGIIGTACAINALILWPFLFKKVCQEEWRDLDLLMKVNVGAAAEYWWIKQQFNLPLGWTLGRTFNPTNDPDNDC